MSIAKVLRLDDYRGKRAQRLQVTEALHRWYPERHAVFIHLAEIADVSASDRAALVWVDEYGAGVVHAHVVLDRLEDRPRRDFSDELLSRAWELGIPGALDAPAPPSSALPSSFAISLGSDGMRAWFIVAESSGQRAPLDDPTRSRLMFLAGECAAIVLHRELVAALGDEDVDGSRFPGWPILRDLEDRETDEDVARRIAQRFVVSRLVRTLVEDDLATPAERTVEQVRRARAELARDPGLEGTEVQLWHRVLDALEAGALEELGQALVELADVVEAQDHRHGALELYDCAYDIAAGIGAVRPAVEAARLSARLLRRRAERDEARRRYQAGHDVATAAELHDLVAHAKLGLANIKLDAGNVPAARRGYEEALGAAERSGNRDALASVHHAFLGLGQASGNLEEGLRHGWTAVATYESEVGRTRCMAGLAAALQVYGDRQAAEDAWRLVAHSSTENYYLLYAYEALAHLAALKGDREGFESHAARSDSLLALDSVSLTAKSDSLLDRGLSYRALGDVVEARDWLTRAVAFAEEHRFNRVLFEAEAALGALEEPVPTADETSPAPAAPPELREGLRAMRRELVGVGE